MEIQILNWLYSTSPTHRQTAQYSGKLFMLSQIMLDEWYLLQFDSHCPSCCMILCGPKMSNKATKNHFDSGKDEVVSFQFFYFLQTKIHLLVIEIVKVSQWRKITIIFEWFIVLIWKYLNFQLFCFCYSVVNVGSAFTEAQPGSSLTALCFEIVCLLLRKIVERGFQILTLMNFHEPLEIKCNFQRPSSSDSPLLHECFSN